MRTLYIALDRDELATVLFFDVAELLKCQSSVPLLLYLVSFSRACHPHLSAVLEWEKTFKKHNIQGFQLGNELLVKWVAGKMFNERLTLKVTLQWNEYHPGKLYSKRRITSRAFIEMASLVVGHFHMVCL